MNINGKERLTKAGYKALDEVMTQTKNVGYFSAEMGAKATSLGGTAIKEGAKNVWITTDAITSNTFSQINRYTPDLYDVGGYGHNDMTADAGMFIAGNTAMVADNAIKMVRTPLAYGVGVVIDHHYSDARMDKIQNKSKEFANFEVNKVKVTQLSYHEIVTGQSRKDVVFTRDRYLWNRYQPNVMSGKNLAITNPANANAFASVLAKQKLKNEALQKTQVKANAFYHKFKANKYDRVLGHKQGLQSYQKYLRRKQFSLKRSTFNMFKNQRRKLANQTIRGNDPNSTVNKTMWFMNKGAEATVKGAIKLWKKRLQIRHFFSALRHPIRTTKAVITSIIATLTAIVNVIATIPVMLSIVAVLAPLILIAVCFLTIISSVLGWFTTYNGYTYSNIELCDIGNSIKDLANETAITARSSEQWKLFNENKYGEVKHDSWGLAYIEDGGKKWYCNAFGTYYTSTIGDKFRVTLDSGVQIYVINCDVKADKDTHKGNNSDSNACLSADGSMMEFYGYVTKETIPKLQSAGFSSLNSNFDAEHQWKGAVVKIEKATKRSGGSGSITGDPDFSNTDAWQTLNPYAPSYYGQCTWFAWGRFYEIYGYSPGFTGNGCDCVGQLLQAHPDKFEYSKTAKAGAVGSSDSAHNHVWIVTGVDGDTLTVQEGNLDGITNDWATAIKDWHTTTYTYGQLAQYYGDYKFANPK